EAADRDPGALARLVRAAEGDARHAPQRFGNRFGRKAAQQVRGHDGGAVGGGALLVERALQAAAVAEHDDGFQAAVADHEVGDGRRARLHADVDGTKRGAEVIDFDDVTPGGHFGEAVAPPLVADRLEAGAADPHAGTGERRTGRRV